MPRLDSRDRFGREDPDATSSRALSEALAQIRDARFAHGLSCPRCRSGRCVRWGWFTGRQRYRCRGCGRTFSDLTGTPVAYSKRLLVWRRYGQCLGAGVSVRKSAELTRIHPATAFRWRHAVFAAHRAIDAQRVEGWIEVEAAWFPWSEKGRRGLDREARRRGVPSWAPRTRDGVSVLIACDRAGRVVSASTGRAFTRRLTHRDMDALESRAGQRPIIAAADGSYSAPARFARLAGGTFADTRSAIRPPGPLAHTRTAQAYRRRLFDWMRRFRGVATKYLPNYLEWHRLADLPLREQAGLATLRWPIGPPR